MRLTNKQCQTTNCINTVEKHYHKFCMEHYIQEYRISEGRCPECNGSYSILADDYFIKKCTCAEFEELNKDFYEEGT